MEPVLIVTLAAVCTVLPLWIGMRFGVVRYVSPLHLLAYFSFIGFFLKVSVYAYAPDLAFYRRFALSPHADLKGAIYLGAFIVMICAGYLIAYSSATVGPSAWAARQVAGGITRRGGLFACALGATIFTIALVLRERGVGLLDQGVLAGLNTSKQINVNADGIGATLAGIKTFFVVPKFAFILLFAHGLVRGSRISFLCAGILAVVMVVIAIISGDRFELIEMVIFGLATFAITGGQIGVRAVVIGGGALCFIGVVSAYMTALRFGGDGSPAVLVLQIVGSTYFLDINAATMVTDRMDRAHMLLGQSYTWWSFGWVPRAVWPDKPAIDLGVFFKRDVMHIYTGGAFNVTGPGEAFINFGWFGLSMGGVLGAIYRKGEVALLCTKNTLRYGSAFLYPILFYPFVQATLQSSFSAFIVGAAAQWVLIVVMACLFVRRFSLWSQRRRAAHNAA